MCGNATSSFIGGLPTRGHLRLTSGRPVPLCLPSLSVLFGRGPMSAYLVPLLLSPHSLLSLPQASRAQLRLPCSFLEL